MRSPNHHSPFLLGFLIHPSCYAYLVLDLSVVRQCRAVAQFYSSEKCGASASPLSFDSAGYVSKMGGNREGHAVSPSLEEVEI